MKYILILSLLLLTWSCGVLQNHSAEQSAYFEGEVTYLIEYFPYSQNYTSADIEPHVGSKMVMNFKEGNSRKTFYAPTGEVLYEIYVNAEKGVSYNKHFDNDTIFTIDAKRADSMTEFVQIQDSIVLDYKTTVLETITTMKDGVKLKGETHFAKELKVDAKWFSDFVEENYNKQISVGQGIEVLSISEGVYWKRVRTAVKVERKEIDLNDIRIQLLGTEIMKEL